MIGRRGFITGLISFVAAPAIVRAGSLMPVKQMLIEVPNMTATEIAAIYGRSPAMDILPSALDLENIRLEFIRIMAVPQHWLVKR